MILKISDDDLRNLLRDRISTTLAEPLSYIGESILCTPVGSLEKQNDGSWNLMLEEEDDIMGVFFADEEEKYHIQRLDEVAQTGENKDGSI